MKTKLDQVMLKLERLQMVALRGARGALLTCEAGKLWITQEGFLKDDFLAPGRSLRVETDGMVLIEALSPSSARLNSAAQPAACTVV